MPATITASTVAGTAPVEIAFSARDSTGFADLLRTPAYWQVRTASDDVPGNAWEMWGLEAAYFFETPGTYVVSLWMGDPDAWTATPHATATVVVSAFAGATYYVSAVGNDLLDGLSPATAWRTPERVAQHVQESHQGSFVANPRRYLFRRGDVFQTSSPTLIFVPDETWGPLQFGAFGDAGGALPQIRFTQTADIGATDVRALFALGTCGHVAIGDLRLTLVRTGQTWTNTPYGLHYLQTSNELWEPIQPAEFHLTLYRLIFDEEGSSGSRWRGLVFGGGDFNVRDTYVRGLGLHEVKCRAGVRDGNAQVSVVGSYLAVHGCSFEQWGNHYCLDISSGRRVSRRWNDFRAFVTTPYAVDLVRSVGGVGYQTYEVTTRGNFYDGGLVQAQYGNTLPDGLQRVSLVEHSGNLHLSQASPLSLLSSAAEPPSLPAAGTSATITNPAGTTTFAAPCNVALNCTGSTYNAGTWMTARLRWNMGDGTTREGFCVAHVYETPGTYVVTLTITAQDGTTDTDSLTLTVLAYTPAAITYVSGTGNDTTGSGTQGSPYRTLQRACAAQTGTGANKAILLERGYTYTLAVIPGDNSRRTALPANWSGTASQPFILGAYGTGARPIVHAPDANGPDVPFSIFSQQQTLNWWRVIDLDFLGPYAWGQPSELRLGVAFGGSRMSHCLFLRDVFRGWWVGYGAGSAPTNWLVGNTLRACEFRDNADTHIYSEWQAGLALLGCNMGRVFASHMMRLPFIQRYYGEGNTWRDGSDQRTTMKFHGGVWDNNGTPVIQGARWVWVDGDVCYTKSESNAVVFSVHNFDEDQKHELEDGCFQRMQFRTDATNMAYTSKACLEVSARRVVVRNNVCDFDTGAAGNGFMTFCRLHGYPYVDASRNPRELYIANNSVRMRNGGGSNMWCSLLAFGDINGPGTTGDPVEEVYLRNNAFHVEGSWTAAGLVSVDPNNTAPDQLSEVTETNNVSSVSAGQWGYLRDLSAFYALGSTWDALAGGDKGVGSLAATSPGFAAAGDFRITPASAAYLCGANLPEVQTDIDQRLRLLSTGGASDAGAYHLEDQRVPSTLTAVAAGRDAIDLAWNDRAGDETGYLIERAPDVGGAPGAWAAVHAATPNATSHRDTQLEASTTYHYRLRPTRLAQASLASSPAASATTAASGGAVGTVAIGVLLYQFESGFHAFGNVGADFRAGFALFQIADRDTGPASHSSNVSLYLNTHALLGTAPASAQAQLAILQGDVRTVSLRGNLLDASALAPGAGRPAYLRLEAGPGGSAPALAQITSDHNWVRLGGSPVAVVDAFRGLDYTWAGWVGAGFDLHGVWNTDPQFANPAAGNLVLGPVSPAANGVPARQDSVIDAGGGVRLPSWGSWSFGAYQTPRGPQDPVQFFFEVPHYSAQAADAQLSVQQSVAFAGDTASADAIAQDGVLQVPAVAFVAPEALIALQVDDGVLSRQGTLTFDAPAAFLRTAAAGGALVVDPVQFAGDAASADATAQDGTLLLGSQGFEAAPAETAAEAAAATLTLGAGGGLGQDANWALKYGAESLVRYPKGAWNVWRAAAVTLSKEGYARGLRVGEPFVGFAVQRAEVDRSGANVSTYGQVTIPVTGASGPGDLGRVVYALTDSTFTLAAGGTPIGAIIRHVSGSMVTVWYQGIGLRSI